MQLQKAVLISPTQMTFSCLNITISPKDPFSPKQYCDLTAAYPLQCVTQRAANTTQLNKHRCIFCAKQQNDFTEITDIPCVTVPVLTSHAVHAPPANTIQKIAVPLTFAKEAGAENSLNYRLAFELASPCTLR